MPAEALKIAIRCNLALRISAHALEMSVLGDASPDAPASTLPDAPAGTVQCDGPMSVEQCTREKHDHTCTGTCEFPLSPQRKVQCCCPDVGKDRRCRLNPFEDNGTSCVLDCCVNNWVACGYGCCPAETRCGFWTTSGARYHQGNLSAIECCVTCDRDDLPCQDSSGCCEWGAGKDCRDQTKSCCLKCPKAKQYQDASGMTWSLNDAFDPEYHCQVDCSLWKPPSIPWCWIAPLGIGGLVVCVFAALLERRHQCLSRRCARVGCRGDQPRGGHLQTMQEPLDLERTDDDELWLALLIGVGEFIEASQSTLDLLLRGRRRRYARLDRVKKDIDKLSTKLKAVQPKMQYVIKSINCEATKQGIMEAKRTIIAKIAAVRSPKVIVFFGGHGHDDHIVTADQELIQVSAFLEELQSAGGKPEYQQPNRAQIVAFFDTCRVTVPSDMETPEPFQPPLPHPSDGSVYTFYATGPGRVAEDGVFTEVLLTALDTPGLTLTQLHRAMGQLLGGSDQRVHFSSNGQDADYIVINGSRPLGNTAEAAASTTPTHGRELAPAPRSGSMSSSSSLQ